MNWLDIVLIVILGASVFSGLARGMARMIVGIAATILAIVLAAWFYGSAGAVFQEYVSSRGIANILGFLLIFIGIMVLGAATGALLAKLFKWVGLGWLDRLLGGGVGLLQGVLVSIVFLMILMAFTPKPPPQSVVHSRIAPYILEAAAVLSYATPHELKEGFSDSYEQVKKAWAEAFRDVPRKPPTEKF